MNRKTIGVMPSQMSVSPVEVNSGERVITVVGGDQESTREAEERSTREAEQAEAGGEERKVVKVLDPRQPTDEERRTHNLTHLPYRSWCEHCVKGRGRETDHKHLKSQPEVEGLHELHFDYMFMGPENKPRETLTILVVKERRTKMLMSTAIPSKSTGKFITARVGAFIRELGIGHLDIVAKSDQEPSIKKLVEDVGRSRGAGAGRWITEFSPVGSSASNGVVERGIQSVQGQIRTIKDGLESRWKREISAVECVAPWIVEWSAHVLNRFEVGKDGRASYERCKGKPARHLGIEFGEAVLWRRKHSGGALGKLSSAWSNGVFLGVKGLSGEVIVSDTSGVYKSRTVHRKPIGDRWDVESSNLIQYAPWKVNADDEKADGDVLVAIKLTEEEIAEQIREKEFDMGDTSAPRRLKITKADLGTHGYSARCDGCRAALAGRPAQNHSEECRRRVLEAIGKDDPRLGAQKQRFNEFLDKAATKEDSDDVQREKKRVRFEGPEGGRTFRRLQLFLFLKKRS